LKIGEENGSETRFFLLHRKFFVKKFRRNFAENNWGQDSDQAKIEGAAGWLALRLNSLLWKFLKVRL